MTQSVGRQFSLAACATKRRSSWLRYCLQPFDGPSVPGARPALGIAGRASRGEFSQARQAIRSRLGQATAWWRTPARACAGARTLRTQDDEVITRFEATRYARLLGEGRPHARGKRACDFSTWSLCRNFRRAYVRGSSTIKNWDSARTRKTRARLSDIEPVQKFPARLRPRTIKNWDSARTRKTRARRFDVDSRLGACAGVAGAPSFAPSGGRATCSFLKDWACART